MKEDDTELGDSVNDVVRTKPDADEGKAAADLSVEDLLAVAGKDDHDEDEDAERDDKGRFVPRARLDELTAQRNSEREKREAAEARAADLERQQNERAEAARVAAEKVAQTRDFDAERAAIEKRYDENDIDAAVMRTELRAIDKAEREQDRRIAKDEALAELRAEQKRQHEDAEARTAEQIEADATAAATAFIEDPANAAYKTDRVRIAALNAYREEVYLERKGQIGWTELLAEARKRVEEYLTPKAGDETPQQRVTRERREAQARTTAAVSTLPQRPDGGVGTRGTTKADDESDLTPEEYRKLPKAERDKRLGRTA